MNQACIKILNYCIFMFWLILSYIYVVHSEEIIKTGIGKSLLISLSILWIIRILILQPVYIGIKTKDSKTMIAWFVVGFLLNTTPLILNTDGIF